MNKIQKKNSMSTCNCQKFMFNYKLLITKVITYHIRFNPMREIYFPKWLFTVLLTQKCAFYCNFSKLSTQFKWRSVLKRIQYLIRRTYFNLWNATCTKNEIDISYVEGRAMIGRALIFNTNSFASKILTLLTKIEYTVHVPKSCSR